MLFPASWQGFFQWIEETTIGTVVRDSLWQFAAIEAVHLLALAVMGGAVLIVDFRLLGLTLKRHPVSQIARDAQPWLVGGLIMMIVSGYPLMASLANSKYFGNYAFQLKMLFFVLGILFTFTVRHWLIHKDDSQINPTLAKLVALVSLALWSGVGIMGRGIGFY